MAPARARPARPGSWGICPTRFLTGLDCPGCGGLRAVNDLTNGDLVGAASSNLLFVAAIPFLVLGWLLWLRSEPRARGDLQTGRWTPWWATTAIALTVVFVGCATSPGNWLAALEPPRDQLPVLFISVVIAPVANRIA